MFENAVHSSNQDTQPNYESANAVITSSLRKEIQELRKLVSELTANIKPTGKKQK